jgi:hypothetical protein
MTNHPGENIHPYGKVALYEPQSVVHNDKILVVLDKNTDKSAN